MAGSRSTQKRPGLVIIGGPNGCGKSTLSAFAARQELLFGALPVNPDDLTAQVRASWKDIGATEANLIAIERAEKAIWRAIAGGESAAVETVLSTDKYVAVVKIARDRRYRTRLLFIGLPSVDLAIERVATRVKLGGHDVPTDKIRDRWGRAHDNLVTFIGLVDEVLIFSNVGDEPVLVAERPKGGAIRFYDLVALPEVTRRLHISP